MVRLANDATRRRCFGGVGNASRVGDFSVGPPVKTGGFPRPYGGRGGAGVARSKKCFRPLGEALSRAKNAGFAVDSSGCESQGVSP